MKRYDLNDRVSLGEHTDKTIRWLICADHHLVHLEWSVKHLKLTEVATIYLKEKRKKIRVQYIPEYRISDGKISAAINSNSRDLRHI